MNRMLTARKLFLAFSLLGFLNIILAYGFFYYSSVSLLEERSSRQMDSVRVLASQKLKLYFDNLKINSVQRANEAITGKEFPHPYKVIDAEEEKYTNFQPLSFYPDGAEKIMIKVPVGKKFVVWEYDYNGLNRILDEHTGLGKTGEIYLVGHDFMIKSASRHVKDWKNIRVDNESIRLGHLDKFGVHIVKDYRNQEVVSAYSSFTYDYMDFVILSEIDKNEVFMPLESLFPKVFMICLTLTLIATVIAYLSSEKILKLIEEMRTQINKLHIQFMTAMEEENRKTSLNLHDGVGQILTAIKWGISRQEDPEKLKELCDDAFKEIRVVSNNLMPTELTELGFYPAVKNFFRKQASFCNIKTHFWHNDRIESYQFQKGLDVNLYRMIQELFQNTLKHGEDASSVSLVMFKEGDNLVLRYEDDGKGMDDALPNPRVLQYRSDLMGAKLIRQSLPKGLAFQIQIPLKRIFSDYV
jgi:signal transduction histidine kinase